MIDNIVPTLPTIRRLVVRLWSRSSLGIVVGVLIVLLMRSAAQAQTLHQLFNINPDGINDVGIRYFGGSFGVQSSDPNFGPIATDGNSLLLFDKNEYVRRIHTLGFPAGSEPFYTTEIRMPFVGSGLSMIQLNNAVGEVYEWDVVDAGANNSFNIVASGTSSTSAATIAAQTVTLVPQGTLPTDRIHMLRVRPRDSDGLHAANPGGKWRVILDAIGVFDDVPLTFDDDSNVSSNWTYSGGWTMAFDNNAYEGTRSATNVAAETVSFTFTGTSIAVLGYGSNSGTTGGPFGTGNSASGTYHWQIDGGAGGSGIVDQSLDHNFALRWPELLVNGLSPGQHTLELRVVGASPVTSGDYNGNGAVDAADYVVWRKNLGMNIALQNENPAATTPGVVDQEDYEFWRARFGTGGGAMFSPNGGFVQVDAIAVFNPGAGGALNIPEPSSLMLLVIAGTFARMTRPRRHV